MSSDVNPSQINSINSDWHSGNSSIFSTRSRLQVSYKENQVIIEEVSQTYFQQLLDSFIEKFGLTDLKKWTITVEKTERLSITTSNQEKIIQVCQEHFNSPSSLPQSSKLIELIQNKQEEETQTTSEKTKKSITAKLDGPSILARRRLEAQEKTKDSSATSPNSTSKEEGILSKESEKTNKSITAKLDGPSILARRRLEGQEKTKDPLPTSPNATSKEEGILSKEIEVIAFSQIETQPSSQIPLKEELNAAALAKPSFSPRPTLLPVTYQVSTSILEKLDKINTFKNPHLDFVKSYLTSSNKMHLNNLEEAINVAEIAANLGVLELVNHCNQAFPLQSLISNEEIHSLPLCLVAISGTLKNMVNNLSLDSNEPISIPCSSETYQHLCSYATNPAKALNLTVEEIVKLGDVADFLEIPELSVLCTNFLIKLARDPLPEKELLGLLAIEAKPWIPEKFYELRDLCISSWLFEKESNLNCQEKLKLLDDHNILISHLQFKGNSDQLDDLKLVVQKYMDSIVEFSYLQEIEYNKGMLPSEVNKKEKEVELIFSFLKNLQRLNLDNPFISTISNSLSNLEHFKELNLYFKDEVEYDDPLIGHNLANFINNQKSLEQFSFHGGFHDKGMKWKRDLCNSLDSNSSIKNLILNEIDNNTFNTAVPLSNIQSLTVTLSPSSMFNSKIIAQQINQKYPSLKNLTVKTTKFYTMSNNKEISKNFNLFETKKDFNFDLNFVYPTSDFFKQPTFRDLKTQEVVELISSFPLDETPILKAIDKLSDEQFSQLYVFLNQVRKIFSGDLPIEWVFDNYNKEPPDWRAL